MSMAADQFAEIVKARLEALGTSPFAVETAAGLPVDAIRNVLRSGAGKAGPTFTRAAEICDALGLEFYIGAPRDSGPVAVAVAQLDGSEYARIPVHDVELAAGDGARNDGEAIIDHLAFRRDWLKRIGIAASLARIGRSRGESMWPTIWDGDMILIDTARNVLPVRQREPRDQRRSPIYALRDGDQMRIKRLERPSDDLVMLVSDNPDFPPELRPIQDITVLGKVAWWGHTVRD